MDCTNAISAEEARRLLRYCSDTGKLFWRDGCPRQHMAGAAAGSQFRDYLRVRIFGRRYYAHRLVWLIVHGRWPSHCIDHVNGNGSDNRIENLRDVPQKVNSQNIHRATVNSSSRLLGAVALKGTTRWRAEIKTDGKKLHLGLFDSAEEAHAAYVKAKRKLHQGCTI